MEKNKNYSPSTKYESKAYKEIYGALKGKQGIAKPKVTYFDWLVKRGGWKRLGAVFSGLALLGYIADLSYQAKSQSRYVEAKMLLEKGVRPVEMGPQYSNEYEISKGRIKDRKDVVWGQSHIKGTETRD